MARTLIVEIVTPERIVYNNEVEMVVAPAIDGEVGILPLHVPLVTALNPGEIRVKYGDTTEWFAISGGYMQVHEDKVIVLADHAAAASHIDVERARQAVAHAQERLTQISAEDKAEIDACQRDLKWCEVQLKVGAKAQ
jgi:F-type H+-transporting ATPase subunit epsilon